VEKRALTYLAWRWLGGWVVAWLGGERGRGWKWAHSLARGVLPGRKRAWLN
jgi:hypothetical protein